MDNKLAAIDLFCIYLLITISSALNSVHAAPITSCSQTPYPEVCNHFMGMPYFESKTLNRSNQLTFHGLALKVTLDQAIGIHRLVSSMDIDSFDNRSRSAWRDCLELYRDTVYQLKRSIKLTDYVSPSYTQTWLSAAVANQQTCRTGFTDFNLTSHHTQHFSPLGIHNLSKLLSNSLAINKATMNESSNKLTKFSKTPTGGNRRLLVSEPEFPAWISSPDRKLLEASDRTKIADVVVAKDGSGNFKTISEAIGAVAAKIRNGRGSKRRFVIYVKAGVYRENVEIKKWMKKMMIVGDGVDATIVTGNKNVKDGFTTFRSATFAVSGQGFIGRDMTFVNTAGPEKHQAVALRCGSDFSVFYRCRFKGYQDTLYVHSHRQFYRECSIYGTVDFVFGDAAAIFQRCIVYALRPMANQKNTVTAQSRSDPYENTGIVFHQSTVTGAATTYLGRPWRRYSRTLFMRCVLDAVVDPAGWLPWNGDFGLDTLYYGEYNNTGDGADVSKRVKWEGFHVITSASEAGKFTAGDFLAGMSWIPATGVPFGAGL